MLHNVGGWERSIRILAGIAVAAAAHFQLVTGAFATAAYVVGAVMLATGVVGYCPAWTLFGINTCHTESTRAHASRV